MICTLEFSEVAFVPFGLKQSLKMLLSFLLVVIVAIGGALVNFCDANHPSDTNRSCKMHQNKVRSCLQTRTEDLYRCSVLKETSRALSLTAAQH